MLSSQIEGTPSTLEDLLEVELEPHARRAASDVGDIVNYVAAMNYGLKPVYLRAGVFGRLCRADDFTRRHQNPTSMTSDSAMTVAAAPSDALASSSKGD